MEKLPKEFVGRGEVAGVQFKQLFGFGLLYIYKRTEPEGSETYEVIRAKEQKENTIKLGGVAVHYPAKETYPKADYWGAYERATTNLDKAIKYFNQFALELGYDIELKKEMV